VSNSFEGSTSWLSYFKGANRLNSDIEVEFDQVLLSFLPKGVDIAEVTEIFCRSIFGGQFRTTEADS